MWHCLQQQRIRPRVFILIFTRDGLLDASQDHSVSKTILGLQPYSRGQIVKYTFVLLVPVVNSDQLGGQLCDIYRELILYGSVACNQHCEIHCI